MDDKHEHCIFSDWFRFSQ